MLLNHAMQFLNVFPFPGSSRVRVTYSPKHFNALRCLFCINFLCRVPPKVNNILTTEMQNKACENVFARNFKKKRFR